MLEKLVNKAEESIKKALCHANKVKGINDKSDKTDILNAEYYMGQFYAYMEMIEDISLNKYVEIGEKTREISQKVLEAINKIYG